MRARGDRGDVIKQQQIVKRVATPEETQRVEKGIASGIEEKRK